MNRIAHCAACAAIESGVKTRIALEHSCGLEDLPFSATEKDIIEGETDRIRALIQPRPTFELVRLGEPETVGDLRKLLNQFPDDMSFGFRNQPRQVLYQVVYDGKQSICFQEI